MLFRNYLKAYHAPDLSRAVSVDEDARRRASRVDQGKFARRNTVLEQPLLLVSHDESFLKKIIDTDWFLVKDDAGDSRLEIKAVT